MNLKSIIITSFALISIVSCKPDTKDYEKKLANEQQKLNDAVNQIEKDRDSLAIEVRDRFQSLAKDFEKFIKTKKCSIYEEGGEAFLKRAIKIQKDIIEKTRGKDLSILYQISPLAEHRKNSFFEMYYKILWLPEMSKDCEKEKNEYLLRN